MGRRWAAARVWILSSLADQSGVWCAREKGLGLGGRERDEKRDRDRESSDTRTKILKKCSRSSAKGLNRVGGGRVRAALTSLLLTLEGGAVSKLLLLRLGPIPLRIGSRIYRFQMKPPRPPSPFLLPLPFPILKCRPGSATCSQWVERLVVAWVVALCLTSSGWGGLFSSSGLDCVSAMRQRVGLNSSE
jgi:hypothetical protein